MQILSRPAQHAADPVHTLPLVAIVPGMGLSVGASDVAVIARQGAVVGLLHGGQYPLDPHYLTFLWNLRDAQGGISAEIVFVSREFFPSRFSVGGDFTTSSGASVRVHAAGHSTFHVADPGRFVSTAGPDPAARLANVSAGHPLAEALRQALTELLAAGTELDALAADPTALGRRASELARASVAPLGLELSEMGALTLSIQQPDAPAPAPAPAPGDIYEMLWDCRHCGAKKLLGLSHRHCPNCGSPQDAGARYFPSDDEKVAVRNHRYFGADRICLYCQNANGRESKHCATCGAPLAEGSDARVRGEQIHAIGAYRGETSDDARRELSFAGAPRPSPVKKRSRWKIVLAAVGAFLFALFALLMVAIFWTEPASMEVSGHEWKREIDVERFGPVQETAWCDRLPSGARVQSRSRAVRSHERVKTGEDCRTKKVDQGDGTFRESRVCEPVYREKPIYDDECRYSIDKWSKLTTLTRTGSSLTEAPTWPEPRLAKTGQCVGCEREGKRREKYTVRFVNSETRDEARCDFDQARWQGFRPGARFAAEITVLGGVLDCSSLVSR